MRQLFKNTFAVATVAAALVSCSKEMDTPNNPKGGFIMTVKTATSDTKTVITDTDSGNSYGINWETTDKLAVYEVANGEVQAKAESAVLGGESSTSEASFTLLTSKDPEPVKCIPQGQVFPQASMYLTEFLPTSFILKDLPIL